VNGTQLAQPSSTSLPAAHLEPKHIPQHAPAANDGVLPERHPWALARTSIHVAPIFLHRQDAGAAGGVARQRRSTRVGPPHQHLAARESGMPGPRCLTSLRWLRRLFRNHRRRGRRRTSGEGSLYLKHGTLRPISLSLDYSTMDPKP